MKKPVIPPMLPTPEAIPAQASQVPKAFVRQPVNLSMPTQPPAATAARTVQVPAEPKYVEPEYVDPYLFEIGYYASRAEYEELSRTAATRLKLRAEVENARPRRKN